MSGILYARDPRTVVDALGNSLWLRQIAGTVVFTHDIVGDGIVYAKFAPFGCICYVFWYAAFWFCTVRLLKLDQSLLRQIYQSKLKQYGDYWEAGLAILYVVYIMFKIPFGFNKGRTYIQVIVSIDRVLRNSAQHPIHYKKMDNLILSSGLAQLILCILHAICLYCIFIILNVKIPHELIFFYVFVNFLILNTMIHYAIYLYILKVRFRIINRKLHQIKRLKGYSETGSWIREDERKISSAIRTCARIYSLIHKAAGAATRMFGLALSITLFSCVLNIILHLFYFMEVHAKQLFQKNYIGYMCFLVYSGWEVCYGLGVIVMSICYCEATVQEGKKTAHLAHQIINKEMSSSITIAAMQLSQQLLHQSPGFSSSGLYKLEYVLLMQGARSVATFLVILLQFVTRS